MAALRTWSPQQQRIFQWFEQSEGSNLVVAALAGTGKTTTILEGINRAPEDAILLCAFNKRIQEELAARLSNPHADAVTLHALGFRAVRASYQGCRVARNVQDRADQLTSLAIDAWKKSEGRSGLDVPVEVVKLVSKLHTLGRETTPHAESGRALDDLQAAHDLTLDAMEQQKPANTPFTPEWIADRAAEAMLLAQDRKLFMVSGIDFADMLYLPIVLDLVDPEYDLVVVDEAQDMTVAQLELALLNVRSGGRVCIVGDRNQAIYGFRGADSGSLDRLKSELDAEELPLTVTYRCGHAIVREAQTLVPDFEAAESNGPGAIRDLAIGELFLELSATQEDFVLSRTNAPLATVAMQLIRNGVRCRIAGKDIGAGLLALVKKLDRRGTMPSLLEALGVWEQKEIDRLLASRRDNLIPSVQDKADTIRVLAEGVVGPKELTQRIDALFSDSGRGQVVCSTVHKAKGLEARRVYVLKDTLYPRWGEAAEERNVTYVAITRAIETLTWVTKG